VVSLPGTSGVAASRHYDTALSNFQRAAERDPEHVYTTIGCLDAFDQNSPKRANVAAAKLIVHCSGGAKPTPRGVDELRRAQRRGFKDKNQDIGRAGWDMASTAPGAMRKRRAIEAFEFSSNRMNRGRTTHWNCLRRPPSPS